MCSCKEQNACGCIEKPKGCAVKISADCVTYDNIDLACIDVAAGTVLTDVIKNINSAICNFPTGSLTIENVGGGVASYKGVGNQGQKQLRTLVSGSTDLTIVQGTDTITFNLAPKVSDVYTTAGTLNTTTGALVFSRTDANNYTVDLSTLLQIQANVLETNTAAKGFIQNKNPTKTIAVNYTLLTTDNNYVIEIDNTTNNIVITIPTGLPNNYFVGFIQKGTGAVTFAGFDIKPLDSDPIIYGQGHNAAVEVINGTRYVFGNLRAS